MPMADHKTKQNADRARRRGPFAVPVALLVFALAGCSTDMFSSHSTGPTGSTSSGLSGFGDKVGDFFRGQPAKPTTAAADAPTDSNIDCPGVEIRQGASTYALNAPGDQSALSLRVQATFGQTARECHVNAGMLTIKVGIQGRLIVGPAGGPGDLTVPIRYALVQEGIEPKTIWTKFYSVPANIPNGSTNVPFSHVQQEMIVPLPKATELEAYVIYVGFDPAGLPETGKKPKSKPQPKAKAHTSSAAAGVSTR
jgi:hypothetical protein